MRKSLLFLIALLFIAPTVFAQRENNFSVFLYQAGLAASESGRHWYSDYAAAFESSLTPHFSAQISVGSERHASYPYVIDETGYVNQVTPVKFRTYPIDLTARYRFVNDTRWKPYIGAGAHYVAAPKVHLDPGFGYQNHIDGEVDGGVAFMFTPALGVMLDGRVIGGERETYDPIFRVSAGLSWRF